MHFWLHCYKIPNMHALQQSFSHSLCRFMYIGKAGCAHTTHNTHTYTHDWSYNPIKYSVSSQVLILDKIKSCLEHPIMQYIFLALLHTYSWQLNDMILIWCHGQVLCVKQNFEIISCMKLSGLYIGAAQQQNILMMKTSYNYEHYWPLGGNKKRDPYYMIVMTYTYDI